MNEIFFGPDNHRVPRKTFFKRLLWAAAGSCALGGLYAWKFEDHWLRIERRPMALPGLGKGLEGARLVHISDLHRGPLVLQRYLHRCIEIINRLDVDFVAITGDFVTMRSRYYIRRVANLLGNLKPKIATIACLGNHDYGVFHPNHKPRQKNLHEYMAEYLSRHNVKVLLNHCQTFRRKDSTLQFVGVEDFWSSRYDPELAFELAHRHRPTIALCHNPDPAGELAALGANWILSGHTHGTKTGRNKISEALRPVNNPHHYAGEYHLGDNRYLYVNRGLAYGRRVNLNARPEITVFTLHNAKKA